jgi:osmotically-inducible protein OsmY
LNTITPELIDRVGAVILSRLRGRICDLRVLRHDGGLVLQGRTRTYYAKQLAQHAVMETTPVPIIANEITVSEAAS